MNNVNSHCDTLVVGGRPELRVVFCSANPNMLETLQETLAIVFPRGVIGTVNRREGLKDFALAASLPIEDRDGLREVDHRAVLEKMALIPK